MSSRYGEIKKAAKEAGVKVCALLAMSEKRDPFYCGAPANMRDAEWFAEQWERFGGSGGHIRRLHYRMLEQGVSRPDKPVPYVNDKASWLFLLEAAPRARHLGLVDPLEVVDKRNEPVRIYSPTRDVEPRPEVARESDFWIAPEIKGFNFDTPLIEAPTLKGYDYSPADQPVRVEIWVEKSGVDDVLDPLCQSLGVNFLTGTGYESITHNIEALRRADKPVRILYVSDFDKAGRNMPVVTGRHIEFYKQQIRPDADVMINQVVLTAEQVERYQLPHAPGDTRVELDALEALHPGALGEVCRRAVEEWKDPELRRRLSETRYEVEDELEGRWDEIMAPHEQELEDIGRQADGIRELFADRVAELRREIADAVEPLEQRYEAVVQQVALEAGQLDIELPDRPTGKIPNVDTSSWVFDSSRDYLIQLGFYRRHKGMG